MYGWREGGRGAVTVGEGGGGEGGARGGGGGGGAQPAYTSNSQPFGRKYFMLFVGHLCDLQGLLSEIDNSRTVNYIELKLMSVLMS